MSLRNVATAFEAIELIKEHKGRVYAAVRLGRHGLCGDGVYVRVQKRDVLRALRDFRATETVYCQKVGHSVRIGALPHEYN